MYIECLENVITPMIWVSVIYSICSINISVINIFCIIVLACVRIYACPLDQYTTLYSRAVKFR